MQDTLHHSRHLHVALQEVMKEIRDQHHEENFACMTPVSGLETPFAKQQSQSPLSGNSSAVSHDHTMMDVDGQTYHKQISDSPSSGRSSVSTTHVLVQQPTVQMAWYHVATPAPIALQQQFAYNPAAYQYALAFQHAYLNTFYPGQ